MARPQSIPKLTQHKASGKAVVRLNGRDHYLGLFGTPEAKSAYDKLIAEWLATGRQPLHADAGNQSQTNNGISVNEVLQAFWTWCQNYYRHPDGTPTTEVGEIRHSLRPVRQLYGLTPAKEFGPRSLFAVQQHVIGLGWCRTLINRRMDRVKRAFKWAASQELIPVSVYEGLRTLSGLRMGRTEARETDPVKPVEQDHVEKSLPFLNRHLRTMVNLQRFTGMRPGEVCKLSVGEIDRTEEPWHYRLSRHKTSHHGKQRVIPFGPKARAELIAFLIAEQPPPERFKVIDLTNPTARIAMADAYQKAGRERDASLLRDLDRTVVLVAGCVIDPKTPLFSPYEAREERFRIMRAKRKSKIQPSQKNRRKTIPRRKPASVYTPSTYAHAIQVAAERAEVPHWHPNQLRHTFGTEIRRTYGLEAAQVLLGHSRADVTQVYAERNHALAVRVASEIG
jgi:integrase